LVKLSHCKEIDPVSHCGTFVNDNKLVPTT
jgi:hypothetical protein